MAFRASRPWKNGSGERKGRQWRQCMAWRRRMVEYLNRSVDRNESSRWIHIWSNAHHVPHMETWVCVLISGLWAYVWHMEEITVLSTRCHERGDRWLLPNFRSRVSAKFQFFCYQQWFMTPTFRSSLIISRYRRVRQFSHPVSKRLIPRCNGTGTDVTSRYYGNKTVTRRHVTGEWRNEWHFGPARGGEVRGWWHQRHKMV